MLYTTETFTDSEIEILKHYFTNLEQPVFCLVNLDEATKGALFARYSRSPKSLKRLFLDEFASDLDRDTTDRDVTYGNERARELYKRVFVEYGDDSIAQLGGVHLACEQSSNLLTKILERSRLMAYLEQSTRYINYGSRLDGGRYRYFRDPAILKSSLGTRYISEMDFMFDTYVELLSSLEKYLIKRYLHQKKPLNKEESELAWKRAIRAKALDVLRGVLPAGSLSNVGLFGSGQSYELLVMRLKANPLPEAQFAADMILKELKKVIPSFMQRVDQPERGGVWCDYFRQSRKTAEAISTELGIGPDNMTGVVDDGIFANSVTAEDHLLTGQPDHYPTVRLCDFDPKGEQKVIAAILYPHSNLSAERLETMVSRMTEQEKIRIMRAYVGNRTNRRHRPDRAFEYTYYNFEIVSDYGAFRDLQRHRMLSIQWQPLSVSLGYTVPELVAEAGLASAYNLSCDRSRELYEALRQEFPMQAGYAVALAYNIRYSMYMNAREAMHVIELRSQPQGHREYRKIAQSMHRLIADVAGHKAIADAMCFVDNSDDELGRLEAEKRNLIL
ncbi:MAG: FAD-dependent thymidylate synthase [Actinobacteria bacterium]|nr:FAD-dependent thymidylate synthase [Actinomycetota bacterium]